MSNKCPECERSNGPHYRGPCDHGGSLRLPRKTAKARTQIKRFPAFRVLVHDQSDGTESVRTYRASSLGEALCMAERADAGRHTYIYGVVADDFAIAESEGLHFNRADGLLTEIVALVHAGEQ